MGIAPGIVVVAETAVVTVDVATAVAAAVVPEGSAEGAAVA